MELAVLVFTHFQTLIDQQFFELDSLLERIWLPGPVEPGELDEAVLLQLSESLEHVKVQVHVPFAVNDPVLLDPDLRCVRHVLK